MFKSARSLEPTFEDWWKEYIGGMHFAVASGLPKDEALAKVAEAAHEAGVRYGCWAATYDNIP